jgi:hypothetical protein
MGMPSIPFAEYPLHLLNHEARDRMSLFVRKLLARVDQKLRNVCKVISTSAQMAKSSSSYHNCLVYHHRS